MTKALSIDKYDKFARVMCGLDTIGKSLSTAFLFDTKRKALIYGQHLQAAILSDPHKDLQGLPDATVSWQRVGM